MEQNSSTNIGQVEQPNVGQGKIKKRKELRKWHNSTLLIPDFSISPVTLPLYYFPTVIYPDTFAHWPSLLYINSLIKNMQKKILKSLRLPFRTLVTV